MTKLITTIDSLRQISSDHGESWGLPSVTSHMRNKIRSGNYVSDPDLFEDAIGDASEIYIAQVCKEFTSDKIFPSFGDKFRLVKKSPIKTENNMEYQFQLWKKR